ncbi:MAG: Holliday junction branch migration protein RuvA, partial [Acidimicrobiia bacterium]
PPPSRPAPGAHRVIGRLRGVLVATRPTGVVVEVGGVGYEVTVAPRRLADLPGLGEEIVLHTHLYVREDALALFGFTSERDRDLFRLLLSASGVGPKVAMGLLASMTAAQLRQAVLAEDADALAVAPGVGRRSAQKLILELRPKLADAEAELISSPVAASQVREALEGLGYQAAEIRDVIPMVDAEAPVAEQLRAALRELGRRR